MRPPVAGQVRCAVVRNHRRHAEAGRAAKSSSASSAAGFCHSDLHIQDGYADLGGGKRLDTTRGMTLPFTLGHEIAGVVDEVGPDAPKDLIGKKQAVFPWIGCGQCRDCANGDENLCVKQRFLGVSIDGGFATHVLVPDAKYLLDYDPLPVNQAATLMCSGVTAYGALEAAGRPSAATQSAC